MKRNQNKRIPTKRLSISCTQKRVALVEEFQQTAVLVGAEELEVGEHVVLERLIASVL